MHLQMSASAESSILQVAWLGSASLQAHERHGVRCNQARDVLDLVTVTERRLASTKFDTRTSPPARPVPARPVPARPDPRT